jgi:hypothetical protein
MSASSAASSSPACSTPASPTPTRWSSASPATPCRPTTTNIRKAALQESVRRAGHLLRLPRAQAVRAEDDHQGDRGQGRLPRDHRHHRHPEKFEAHRWDMASRVWKKMEAATRANAAAATTSATWTCPSRAAPRAAATPGPRKRVKPASTATPASCTTSPTSPTMPDDRDDRPRLPDAAQGRRRARAGLPLKADRFSPPSRRARWRP